ncbi:hypothetical protein COU37_03145 [Candidatus Micrarchaeota archaeon CG10_big_fil_rev_8_21_14_0_10_45_29]|nr:MAG: hypothetical protein COU37_03145 [Candidatus Micrarchaeota archaeon CG10_big_fil_rev_8_21_14_0_10_45_29]
MSIFMLLLAIAYLSWEDGRASALEKQVQVQADEAASRALRAIAKSPGIPSSWASQGLTPDSASLLGIGAASAYNEIDEFKIAKIAQYFNSSPYSNITKSRLGLSPFEADVRISYLNGTDIATMGAPPGASSIVLSSKQRIAVYKNESAIIRVRLWNIQAS